MKIRNFVFVFASIVLTAIVYFFMTDPNLLFRTQGKLKEWQTIKDVAHFEDDVDPTEKYMLKLGFYRNTQFYPEHEWKNAVLPIFVSAYSPYNADLVPGFLKSFQTHLPDYTLIIYDLGHDPVIFSKISALCNSSTCAVRHFDFSSYPSHVQDLKLSAFRPIIIQEVLNQMGAVCWLDCKYIFTSGHIKHTLSKAQKVGILSWSINHPTSALTHPGMFEYFHTFQEKYFFHRMVEPSHIILYNTSPINSRLMEPWVRCALVVDCIAPIGAQSTGCRFDKKPLFRYSGCHRYDMSALNVALGLMFDFTASQYVAAEGEKFFQYVKSDENVPLLYKEFGRNSSGLFSDISGTV